MRRMLTGFVLGVLFALASVGAVTTFTSIQGRGTPASGYIILPTCPADLSPLEFGSVCKDLTTRTLKSKGTLEPIE